MTSSLVGSEMCIRDSLEAMVQQGSTGTKSSVHHVGSRAKAQQGPRSRPVSYTHLTLPTICSV
eukprot:10250854-Prorocentrum_lima.AAC.1